MGIRIDIEEWGGRYQIIRSSTIHSYHIRTHTSTTHTHTHTHTRVHTDAYFCIFIEKVPIQKFPHWRRLFLFFTHTNTLHTPHYQENNISFYTCVSVCQCEFMWLPVYIVCVSSYVFHFFFQCEKLPTYTISTTLKVLYINFKHR